jgi:hypothetical protein
MLEFSDETIVAQLKFTAKFERSRNVVVLSGFTCYNKSIQIWGGWEFP